MRLGAELGKTGAGGRAGLQRNRGSATESAALPNELEWAIEVGPFHREDKVSKQAQPFLLLAGAKHGLLTLGVWASEVQAGRSKQRREAECSC